MAGDPDRDRTPLLLIPGTLCDGRLFAPLLARLPSRPVAVADMHGVRAAGALADRLLRSAPDRFAVLGFSLGAIVALELAARAPDRVAGIALVGGNAHDVSASERDARRAAIAGVDAGDHVAATLWPGYVADPCDRRLRELVTAMARDAPPGALADQTEIAVTRADSRPRLPILPGPVLVIAGAEDAINPPAVQRAMAAAIPGARLESIADAGHFVVVEKPDAAARAVAAWLAAVDAAHATRDAATDRLEETR